MGIDICKESEELLSNVDLSNVCHICDKLLRDDDKVIKCSQCDNKSHIKCVSVKLECDEADVQDVTCDICQAKSQLNQGLISTKGPGFPPGSSWEITNVKLPLDDNGAQSETEISFIILPAENVNSFAGPVKERKCTDLFVLYFKIALAVLIAMLVLMYFGGRTSYMKAHGTDSRGFVCGYYNADNPDDIKDYTNARFVLFEDAIDDVNDLGYSKRECVRECPDNTVRIMQYCLKLGNRSVVSQEVSASKNYVYNEDTNSYDIIDTTSQYVKYDSLSDDIRRLISSSGVPICEKVLQLLALSFGISLIFILIISFATKFFVWTIIVLLYVLLFIVTLFLGTVTLNELTTANDGNCEYCLRPQEKLSLVIITSIMVLATVIGLFKLNPWSKRSAPLKKRINMVATLYNQAGNVIGAVPSIMFLPILTVIFIAMAVSSWVRRALIIETMGLEDETGQIYISNAQWLARILSLMCGMWGIQFIVNCQNMVIAGAVTQWYFTRDKSQVSWPVMRSMWRLVRYHLGTVLLGSLITYPTAFFFYFIKTLCKCHRVTREDVYKVFFLLYMSLLKLFDSFQVMLEMTCNQAYVQTGIYGHGFCKSFSRSLKVQCKYLRNTISVNTFGVTFVVVSKVIITGTIATVAMFGNQNFSDTRLYDLRMMLVLFIGYFVAHLCTSVFQTVTEAVYLCFCEDCLNNDGTKSYFMNNQLEEFIVKPDKEQTRNTDANTAEKTSFYTMIVTQLQRYQPLREQQLPQKY